MQLLDKCSEYDLRLSAKKVQFKSYSVFFMGYKLTDKGVEPDPAKVTAITGMPTPTDKARVQRFLGMGQYLSKFCHNLSETVSHREYSVFLWFASHETAFNSAKNLISSTTALRYYDSNLPVTLQVDASDRAIGGVLLQEGKPFCLTSHTLNSTERNYAQIERECLAIVSWHYYLYDKYDITVHSDHQPLETIFRKPLSKVPRGLQRTMLKFQIYQFTVQYKKGRELFVADTLSRAAVCREVQSPLTVMQECEVFCLELAQWI